MTGLEVGDRLMAIKDGVASRGVTSTPHVTLPAAVSSFPVAMASPAGRAAFVVHAVFGFSVEDIGPIVGRSAAACRQLASRARRRIEEETGPARFELESEDDRRVTERFIAACAGGDLEGLMKVLDPDVVGQADTVIGVRPPVVGKRNVARNALSFFGPDSRMVLVSVPVNGQPGIIAFRDGQPFALITLRTRAGLIEHIDAIADPKK